MTFDYLSAGGVLNKGSFGCIWLAEVHLLREVHLVSRDWIPNWDWLVYVIIALRSISPAPETS